MSHIIQAQHLIVNYFQHHPEANKVSLATISEIKKKIQQYFAKRGLFVYVDYTRDSLINMLNTSGYLFEKEKTEKYIILKNRKKLEEETKRYFNAKVDSVIRAEYLELMETLCKKF